MTDPTENLEVLHFRMTQMTRRLFGSSSERHHPDQNDKHGPPPYGASLPARITW